MKRIKLQQKILFIMTSDMIKACNNYKLWEVKAFQVANFIQNNYRRRIHKKRGKNAL